MKPFPPAQIRKLLDSRHEREVLDGLRRITAMQYASPPLPTLTFFPAVLKTLSNPYPSTRPLVYNYLIHHADADPDTALLSINTIQKSLSDPNPRVRAMALKTMSAIRVPVISQIVSLAIKKGVSDLSPLVRKAAAQACVKCIRLDAGTRPQVEEYLGTLLADKQYYVVGPAIQAFAEICPARLDLIHPVYRKLCRMVVDMDEWAQLAVLRLLTVYARKCFPQQTKRIRRAPQDERVNADDFYEDLEAERHQAASSTADLYDEVDVIDPDLSLLLNSIEPLLSSRNSAVIVATAKAYFYLSPTTHLPSAIGPLVALLRSPQDIQQIALQNIVFVCLHDPRRFIPYIRHFLLRSTDLPMIKSLKLELLTLIFPHSTAETQSLVLAELEQFSSSPSNPDLTREAVRALGRCAQKSSGAISTRCLALLLQQIHSTDTHLVGEAMEVIRHLVQRHPADHPMTVIRLAKNLNTLESPAARASVVWLVGEYASGAGEGREQSVGPDVLRILIRGYTDESDQVREQILLLAAKCYLHYLNAQSAERKSTPPDAAFESSSMHETDRHPIPKLWSHALHLARYTPSYALRDRARTLQALLAVPSSTELANLLLLVPKPVPLAPSPGEARAEFVLGSASLAVGAHMAGISATQIPGWVSVEDAPDPALRRDASEGHGGVKSGGTSASGPAAIQRLDAVSEPYTAASGSKMTVVSRGKKAKTLDDWLDEETESESESESDEDGVEYETESASEEEEESDDDQDERTGLVKSA